MSVVGALANTSRQSAGSWNSPEAVRKTSLVSSSASMKSRVSSSTRRRLQRRLSPRDFSKRISSRRYSPETGKLLCEGQNGREKIAVPPNALQHLVLLERQRVGVLHLIPGHGSGDRGPVLRAQRVDVDGGLVLVVLAPVDQHLAAAQVLRHPRHDEVRVVLLEQLRDRLREWLGVGVGDVVGVERNVDLKPLRAGCLRERLEAERLE